MTDKIDIKKCKSILLPRFDSFGDIVLLQGFIAAVLDFMPEARVTLMVRSGYEQLASMFPQGLIWKTTQINPYKQITGSEDIKSFFEELQKDDYDLLLVTTYNRTWLDDLLAIALPSIKRIALGSPQDEHAFQSEVLSDLSIQMPQQLYNEYIPVEEKKHETEKYQEFWHKITSAQIIIPRPHLIIPQAENKRACDVLTHIGLKKEDFVFCFPAGVANVTLKTWPEENFAAVIAHLEKKHALKTLIAGQEMEKHVVDKVAELARQHGADPLVWLGKDGDIPLACALVAKSKFYLGNDTGLMHMAAALNKPVTAILGGGHWPRFLPVSDIGAVFTRELTCTYCKWEACCFLDAPCVKTVRINKVVSFVEKLLGEKLGSLEIHKDEIIDSMMVDLLFEKSKEAFFSLRRDRNQAVAEIHKRDAWLAELRQINEEILQTLPLVSIVTPVFNGAKWIESCIQSVMCQNYPKIEHIIVDGGSTDGTLDICRKYSHLILHSKNDRGQTHAINKGFSMAQGDILAWLCADDEYEPGAVQAAVEGIRTGNNVVMGYSRFTDAEGKYVSEHPANVYFHYNHKMLLQFWKFGTISQPATFWTRKIWESCGPLRENLYFAMDYDFWLRISRKAVFTRIEAYVAKYRIHPEAKCFSDNYGSRIELIDVSRTYWPAKWTYGYWKLLLQYIMSRGGNTTHYADGVRLLHSTAAYLDDQKRAKAIWCFVSAHFRHPATPLLPEYMMTLKRIVVHCIGPLWFWRLIKKLFTI